MEVPLEVAAGEHQPRRAAVRARMGVVQALGLLEEGADLVRVERVPGHDRGAAGETVDDARHEGRSPEPVSAPRLEEVEDLAERGAGVGAPKDRGEPAERDGPLAE